MWQRPVLCFVLYKLRFRSLETLVTELKKIITIKIIDHEDNW